MIQKRLLVAGTFLLGAAFLFFTMKTSQKMPESAFVSSAEPKQAVVESPLPTPPLGSSPEASPPPSIDEISAAPRSEDVALANWTMEEIVAGRFDRSSEADQKLKTLAPGLKQELKKRYRSLPAENLNGRGSLAFLLGRTAESAADFQFMTEVGTAPICLSATHCTQARDAGSVTSSEAHQASASGLETTLRYPQAMAILQLQKRLNDSTLSSEVRARARQALEEIARTQSDPFLKGRALRALRSTSN